MKEKKSYTIYGDRIDDKIEQKLSIFLETIKTTPLEKYVETVLLTGSYARGVGSVLIYNDEAIDSDGDFDIYVITNREIKYSQFTRILEEIRGKAKFAQNNFIVDLHILNMVKLPNVLPFVRFFDLKYYSKLIYGRDVRGFIPDFAPSDIPIYDGLRLLLNRLFHVADTFDASLLTDHLSPASKVKLSKEICKFYIIALNAFAILIGEFSYNYETILEKIERSTLHSYLSEKIPGYKTKIISIISQKKSSRFEVDKCQDRWKEALSDFLSMIDIYLKIAFDIEENDDIFTELHKISRWHLCPYLRWKLRSAAQINFGENSALIRLGCRMYQLFESIKYHFTSPRDLLRDCNLIAIDPGLKIYWAGLTLFRELLDRVRHNANSTKFRMKVLGAGIEEKSVNEAMTIFSKIYKDYFQKGADTEKVINFGFGNRSRIERGDNNCENHSD
jgi:predicted nucleotidyltransferase